MAYQKIIIVGNCGRDPEMKYLPDGTPVTSFSMATNRKWNNADGSKSEQVTWFKITAWRKLAEIAAQYIQKGHQVMIEGQLAPDANGNPRVWVASDGTPRSSYEVRASGLTLLSNRENATAEPQSDGDNVPF